jgi:DNA invertase Pin-like site-specific DNA recombinase
MIAAIYARKSTEQDGHAVEARSVARQVEGARAFIELKGWTLDEAHVYKDDGKSGALFLGRPEFQRMLRDAEAGAFKTLVIYDLDRFGRAAHKTMVALNTLADLGVAVYDYSTGQAIDLDSFEGGMTTSMRALVAQYHRDQVRKHTKDAMIRKAKAGHVTGGRVFGYDNDRISKNQVERRVNEKEAAVVREIYERFAAGDGARSIARALNLAKVPTPRAQSGRPHGWSAPTIRAVLERPLYRGEVVWGKSAKAYGRELGPKRTQNREKGQIPQPESSWVRMDVPELRIIDPGLAERVDTRRENRKARYLAALKKHGRMPQRAHGKYLLSGGMLICPTCHAHFEARMTPWRGLTGGVYICSTHRRKPGVCVNRLTLPMAETDDMILSMVEGEVLGTHVINRLLELVDTGAEHEVARLEADRDRLQKEIENLVRSIALGVAKSTVASAIRERETEMARVQVALNTPRPEAPDLDMLRLALEQRSEEWKRDLRAEPKVARMLLRRLIGPIELWDEADYADDPPVPDFIPRGDIRGVKEYVGWRAESDLTVLFDRDYRLVASPTGFNPFTVGGAVPRVA